ncbi:hypothetical protein A9Q84_14255 [Halobacteriovorax marinus]|uniref:HTH cro/C1-type domain-containing protein n=1 Tax=Halobacteriovorax marinus TaxID=97084 RepID=A0A1Y5F4S0_9BACT|nr:hypothetical protein A9Q84_14255 [Halobacteriovorax marinus]
MLQLDHSIVYKRLLWIRKTLSYTQNSFAELIDIPIRTYQRLESGETLLNTVNIFKISQALKLCPSVFFIEKLEEYDNSKNLKLVPRIIDFRLRLFDYKTLNDILNELEEIFIQVRSNKYSIKNTAVTEGVIGSCSILNNSWLEEMKVGTIKFSKLLQDHISIVAYWDTMIAQKDETRFHLGHIENDLPNMGKIQAIGLFYASRTLSDNPKAYTFNIRFPLDIKITQEDIIFLAAKLSKRINHQVNPIKKIT